MNNDRHINDQRAVITGGTGFVGSHLARRMVRDGWAVHIVSEPGADRSGIADLQGRISLHEHDRTTERLVAIMAEAKPSVVFHLASLFLSAHRTSDVEPLVRSNVLFGAQLLEAMALAGIQRLVNTGTSWQHYENRDYSPVNLYAATKQAFEAILQYYVETTPMKAITLKLFDTYGPNDPRPKLFHLLKKTADAGEPLAMSPGDQLIDLVYIDDVIEAFLVAGDLLEARQLGSHQSFAVSSGNPISLKSLVRQYTEETGVALKIDWGGRPYRDREVMTPWTKGEWLPRWKPTFDLKEGIKRMLLH